MKNTLLLTFLIFTSVYSTAQPDSCWTVKLIAKDKIIKVGDDTAYCSDKGFYLYQNCVYQIHLENDYEINGRLLNVLEDTLIFTNYLNIAIAKYFSERLDTMKVFYQALKTMNVGARSIAFKNYDFTFKKDTHCNYIPSYFKEIYTNDTMQYEIFPYAATGGFSSVYETYGKMYWYDGGEKIAKPIVSKKHIAYERKNIFWFIPNEVEEINGVAFGAWAENMTNDYNGEKDSLKINGLTIEVNPVMLFLLIRGVFTFRHPDSAAFYYEGVSKDISATKNGVNLSVLGSVGYEKINGFNLGGINTVVGEVNGVSITGLNNFSYLLNGVSVALLRNRATITKGLQVGLFNKSTELRGVQVGLWNINGKRRLPFINWQFKPSKRE